MDEVDYGISRFLLGYCRTPLSEIAREFDTTAQTVHRRVRAMEDEGVIESYVARLSPRALGATQVLVFGWSKAPSYREVAKNLGEHEAMNMMLVGSGNYLYIDAMLRNHLELDDFVSFIREKAEIPSPNVGLLVPLTLKKDMIDDPKLTRADYRILNLLSEDARRPTTEVADELGISSKTVRKRISRMIEEELAHFGMIWHPELSNETLGQIHLEIREEVDPKKLMFTLIKLMGPNLLFNFAFSNMPNFIMPMVWTKTIREMSDISEKLENEGVFNSVVTHHITDVYYYTDWRTALLKERARE